MISACRANADPQVLADKLARVKTGPCSLVNAFVDQIRKERPESFIPYVDPDCGGIGARILLLLQDPGPKSAVKGSGMLSISNDDATAEMVWWLLSMACIPYCDVMLWNAVPWYTGGQNKREDRKLGLCALGPLTEKLCHLEVVVTLGVLATKSWVRAVGNIAEPERFKHVGTLHPSPRGQTRGGRQLAAVGRRQLLEAMIFAKSLLKPPAADEPEILSGGVT